MKVTFEQQPNSEQEQNLQQAIRDTLRPIHLNDCRDIAPAIRKLIELAGCQMVVGCGGSHVWIHRGQEHPLDHSKGMQAMPDRWAIITD